MSRIITRFLPLAALLFVHASDAGAQQPNLRPGLNLGDAVVTGFSGIVIAPNRANKSATDLTFINPDGPSVRVLDVSRPGYAWDGRLFVAPNKFDVAAKDVGQVFGIALDDAVSPNIYVAATSAFGLNIVSRGRDGAPERRKKGGPGAGWMKGQFGLELQGGPGAIYKIDGRTGVATLFANVTLDGVPNPGPGLGNLAYDSTHNQLFVSDLYTGMIHRFDLNGKELGAPFDHGVAGLGAAKLAAVPFNPRSRPNIATDRFDSERPETWGYAPAPRRVWGVAVHDGRLYYSVAAGPQIWSVGIAPDGGFAPDPRWELDVPAQAGALPVSDIAFSQHGAMILAQRGVVAGAYDYSAFTRPGEPQVLRFTLKGPGDPPAPGRWKLTPAEYAVGFAGTYRNSNGGVAFGYGYDPDGALNTTACEAALWTTAQNLRNNPAMRGQLEPGGPLVVHGLQGSPADQVRERNAPPAIAYFVDYDDRFEDPTAAGHIGSVRILTQPCTAPVAAVQSTAPPLTPIAGGVNPPRSVCTPTCVCPPGTALKDGECLKVDICPTGTVMQDGKCVKVILFGTQRCQPPMVPGPSIGSCRCPEGTVMQGRTCVTPQNVCKAPMVAGPCECPQGTTTDGQNCVPDHVGELIVKKAVVYVGPILLPATTYPVNVICGSNTTTLNLSSDGTPQTVSNIPYGTNCSVTEPTPAVPPGVCPPNTTGTWSIGSSPSPIPPISATTTTVTVTNTLTCTKNGDGTNSTLVVNKTVDNQTTANVTGMTFPATVTCNGVATPITLSDNGSQTVSAPAGANCTVNEPVPAGPSTGCTGGSVPLWLPPTYSPPFAIVPTSGTATITVKNTLRCVRDGYVAVVKSITNNTSADVSGLTFPVAITCNANSGTGTVAINLNVTIAAPQVSGYMVPGYTCTPIETLPPAPTTGCPAGSVPTWVTPPVYTPPSIVSAFGLGAVFTVQNTLDCKPQPHLVQQCTLPQIPNQSGSACVCPDGTRLVDGECLPISTCQPPMVRGAVPDVCVCPDGMITRGNTCVERERKKEKKEKKRKKRQQEEREQISPSDVIRGIPGGFGPGRGGGGSPGGGYSPGGGSPGGGKR